MTTTIQCRCQTPECKCEVIRPQREMRNAVCTECRNGIHKAAAELEVEERRTDADMRENFVLAYARLTADDSH